MQSAAYGMESPQFSLLVGWACMAGGATSGAIIGLFFHHEHWLGGYGSFRRRMLRLGHIAFFGLGFLNVLFALSATDAPMSGSNGRLASLAFASAAVTMPACCFLTAWRPSFRQLFPIPVIATLSGLGAAFRGWMT